MESVWMLGIALLFPFVCLGGVLLLAHLEDTLGKDVERARSRHRPAPVRAVPTAPQADEPAVPARTAPATATQATTPAARGEERPAAKRVPKPAPVTR